MEGTPEVDGRWMDAAKPVVCPNVRTGLGNCGRPSSGWSARAGLLLGRGRYLYLRVWVFSRVLPGPVRGCPWDRPAGAPACVHMVYSAPGMSIIQYRLCRSEAIWRCRQERPVKPSAQPTLVRTQHLPPPAKTARSLRKRGPAGRFLLVPPCVIVCRCRAWRSNRYGHMADSVRAEGAVRGTACFADPRPFCPVMRAPGLLA